MEVKQSTIRIIVNDKSGVLPSMDLFITNGSNVSWLANGLSVDASTIIQHPSVDTKLRNACQLTDAITLEVWAKNSNLTQSGPARIMTLSEDSGDRNFTLGQENNEFEGRLRTTSSTNNGTPDIT